MRSSKSRSRNKNNRRPSGNVVNRVFDSSGPEGKVRGTPQQIIDKYSTLARDAQLSGDRVAVENFQQHAEHYTRMLNEALREQAERQKAHEAQQAQQQARSGGQQRDSGDQRGGPAQDSTPQPSPGQQYDAPAPQQATQKPEAPAETVIDVQSDGSSDLVETPEAKPARKPRAQRPRKPRAPKPAADETATAESGDTGPAQPAAE